MNYEVKDPRGRVRARLVQENHQKMLTPIRVLEMTKSVLIYTDTGDSKMMQIITPCWGKLT